MQQCTTSHNILTFSSEIPSELLHQHDVKRCDLSEDEILTIVYPKSKAATLCTVNLLWINTGINKAEVFAAELFHPIAPGDSACISSTGMSQ